ncbi:hypothetical protein [Chondromyces crocatus]|uniref:Uncharacterized protein n=1 Tax=Chondromyces crocatus TaxID=52 RepID=A0A0K1EPT8_CHOCO|nr:hypothetical protein [Chondromyces crocatus]AKT42623.1 uncharacterized protein CMC5_068500 [Chondromyces crocatus]
MMSLPNARWIGLAIAALSAGCGGNTDALEQQLATTRAELVKVRADQAVLADRLAAIERAGRDRLSSPAPRTSPAGGDRPALAVVHMDPSMMPANPPPASGGEPGVALQDSGVDTDPDAEGPRPLLRSTPDGGVITIADPSNPPARKPSPRATSAGKR